MKCTNCGKEIHGYEDGTNCYGCGNWFCDTCFISNTGQDDCCCHSEEIRELYQKHQEDFDEWSSTPGGIKEIVRTAKLVRSQVERTQAFAK